MSTYRERREARAERLREWADKRQVKAAAVFAAGEPMRSDHAFNTQPGHIPQRARLIAREDRAYQSIKKANAMLSRADSIEAAADRAVYDDDPDACERLKERIAHLEAERDRIKAFNASCRKGSPDESLLDERQRADLATLRRVCPYQLGKKGELPGYQLSNLGGRIKKDRDRLARLSDGPDHHG